MLWGIFFWTSRIVFSRNKPKQGVHETLLHRVNDGIVEADSYVLSQAQSVGGERQQVVDPQVRHHREVVAVPREVPHEDQRPNGPEGHVDPPRGMGWINGSLNLTAVDPPAKSESLFGGGG